MMLYGQTLKDWRERFRYTGIGAGRKIGCSGCTISKIENGIYNHPTSRKPDLYINFMKQEVQQRLSFSERFALFTDCVSNISGDKERWDLFRELCPEALSWIDEGDSMARVPVWIPDEVAERARSAGLNVSALAQAAITAELESQATDAWLDTLPEQRQRRVSHVTAMTSLDEARSELSGEA
jgi:post-segregation antitoxin (ccd killing protein)/DNA-binding XRE family transcriptional regulator